MYWNAVDFKDAYISHLADLSAVEQFHLACALIEIIAKRHAIPPLLDFTAFRPELEVDGVAGFVRRRKSAVASLLAQQAHKSAIKREQNQACLSYAERKQII